MTTALALQCEHRVAQIINEQELYGVNFNKTKAQFLIHSLTEKIHELDRQAIPQLPLMMIKGAPFKALYTISGKVQKHPLAYCEKVGLDPACLSRGSKEIHGMTRVSFVPFDMSKTDKVKRVLIDHGWQPTEWNTKNPDKDFGDDIKARIEWCKQYIEKNFIKEKSTAYKNVLLKALGYKGVRNRHSLLAFLMDKRFIETTPKLTEDSLGDVEGTVGTLVMKRVQLSHRRSLIQGLVDRIRPDGRLSAGANSCATPTFRMTHRVVVNIPAARSVYGKEIRSLFIPDEGHKFVGYDGAGLELRMFAHYINDPTYTEVILNGDIHSYNQSLAGLPTRDDAKTFIYATLYGAGDAKIGSIINGSSVDGKAIKERFYSELPGLAKIIEKTKAQAETGYLIGLDGRRVRMRRGLDGRVQTHKALNTLLQSAGAIVMKYSMIFLDNWVKEDGLRAHKVIDMHDEGQWTCHPDDVPRLQYHMDRCVAEAGKFLNLNIPLASDSMVGKSWFDTH